MSTNLTQSPGRTVEIYRHNSGPKVRFFLLLVVILTSLMSASAQQPPYYQPSTAVYTPLPEQPGAPAGSYPLSGFDNINLFNGHINFRLPLMQIGGRGRAGYTMMLPIEQHWQVQTVAVPTCNQSGCTYYESNYRYITNPIWWTGLLPGFSPGVLQGRQGGSDPGYWAQGCSTPIYQKTLTRLTFTAPDGTEFELRDKLYGGEPIMGGGCWGGISRGRVFVTADGSAATFVSDADIYDDRQPHPEIILKPSGYLMLRDGTRYRIDNALTTWIRDPNGNKVTFTYTGNQLTGIDDSLNRHVTITYGNPTLISFKGAGGASRTTKIHSASLSTVLRKYPDGSPEYTIKTFTQLFGLQNSQQGTFDVPVTSAVELPDGRQYQFRYDSYANLAQVILPTGGRFEYDWLTSAYQFGDHTYSIIQRVLERRTALNTTTTTYETRTTYSNAPSGGITTVTVNNLDPKNSNALISRTKHYFYGSSINNPSDPRLYPPWKDGREYQTESFAADGTTVLNRVNHTFQQRAVLSWWTGTADQSPPNDPRLVETTTTLVDTNQVSKSSAISPYTGAVGFDQYNNQTDIWDYDFGSGVPGALLRHTATTYLTSGYDTLIPNSTSPNLSLTYHIRTLPSQVSIYDGGGTERGRTTFEYDNYTTDSFHAALLDRVNISGHDAAVSTSYTARGNPTGITNYHLPAVTPVTTYSQFDIAGNVIKVIDPRSTAGNVISSTVIFDDNFGAPDGSLAERFTFSELGSQQTFAFPTEVRNALNQSAFTQYDYHLAQGINQQDLNGVIVAGFHNDLLDRLTQIRRGWGTTAENQTTFEYDDVNRTIKTKADLTNNNDGLRVSLAIYDGLGRAVEKQRPEDVSCSIISKTEYDGLSRPYRTSNPYRPCQSEVPIWTTRTFDSLGRPVSLITPDNAVVTTSYSGNAVTISDQTNKQRKSVTDALGRLVQEYEAPNDAGYNYLTSYAYDVLGNLTGVSQGFQSRSFAYDSFKRLTSATNPESGTITYQYDNAGNLLVKTDARGVSAHYSYDVLSRMTRRWYNSSSSTASTTHNSPALPAIVGATDEANFYYDQQTLPAGAPSFSRGASIGRVVATTYGGSSSTTGDYSGYDSVGGYSLKIQRTGSTDYQMSVSYNLAAAPTTITYPSGHSVNFAYDNVGRMTSFSGTLGDGTNRDYSTEVTYSPFGGLSKEKFGTTPAIYNKLFYNSRGQLSEIRDSTSWTGPTDTTWNRGAIINHYSDSCSGMCGGNNSTTAMTDNNGNLLKQEMFIPNDDQISSYTMRWQQYHYDKLNRLDWSRETLNGVEQWKQAFVYDRFGNRTIDTGVTYGAGINNKSFAVAACNSGSDPCTNRLLVPGGQTGVMQYDEVGNLTNDTYTGAGNRTYNAENKITSAVGGIQVSGTELYKYDVSGQRVKRTVDNVEVWAVYGPSGEMFAEYPANGAPASPQKEYGYRNGQLLITTQAGSGSPSLGPNLAASSNGAVATASSTYPTVVPGQAINGDHVGVGVPSWWADNTPFVFPDWIQVDFAGSKTVSEISVYGLQQNYSSPVEPTSTMTSSYALTNFEVQYWNGSAWATVPGGSVSGNDKVWRKFTFAPLVTSKIRVYVTNVVNDNHSQVVEIEAYGPVNVAAAGSGAVATASSTYPTVVPGQAINGDHVGVGVPSWWADNTPFVFPDWIQIDFSGTKTIGEIDVYGLQTNYSSPVEPTPTLTSIYALTNFEVQYWNGSAWATVPGGSVSGNDKVWRKFTFAPLTTSKIRVYVTNVATDNHSQVVEIEAYAASASTTIQWLVSDHLGTPRMIFDQSGSLANVKRHDYLPFGEEILGTISGRNSAQGFGGGDAVRQKFSSKERDDETGLDYFGARYFSSVQGRFTSPDPLLLSNKSDVPQSWNRYSYCINSPLRYVDPTGLIWGTYEYEQNGRTYRRYRWFNGDKVAKGWTPFIPAKDGTDIALKGGGGARIWADGSRQYFPAAPPITITGQDNLNLSAGLAHGAATALVNASGAPAVTNLLVDWAFNQVGGVERNSNLYQNGHTIGEWTVTGSLILATPALAEVGGGGGGGGSKVVVNIGGEGEVAGALNVQGKWALTEGWRTSQAGQTLSELQAAGNKIVVADNTALPFANKSVDRVITNSVPIDATSYLGPGVQSSEVWRILKADGLWINNGKVMPR